MIINSCIKEGYLEVMMNRAKSNDNMKIGPFMGPNCSRM